MKFLLVSDLHYTLKQFDWVTASPITSTSSSLPAITSTSRRL